jgi:uncharacterized membrane protein YhhN
MDGPLALALALQAAYVALWVLPLHGLAPDVLAPALGGSHATAYIVAGSLVKSVPVAALGLALIGSRSAGYARSIGTGLLFGSGGDLLLDLSVKWKACFLAGLVSFLVGHLFYVGAFAGQPLRLRPAALPLLAAPVGLVYVLWPGLPADMRAPVVVYASVIAAMALLAVSLEGGKGKGKGEGEGGGLSAGAARLAAAGALVFVVSDSVLAVDRFRATLPLGKLAVMLTYYAAQVLTFLSARPAPPAVTAGAGQEGEAAAAAAAAGKAAAAGEVAATTADAASPPASSGARRRPGKGAAAQA